MIYVKGDTKERPYKIGEISISHLYKCKTLSSNYYGYMTPLTIKAFLKKQYSIPLWELLIQLLLFLDVVT